MRVATLAVNRLAATLVERAGEPQEVRAIPGRVEVRILVRVDNAEDLMPSGVASAGADQREMK